MTPRWYCKEKLDAVVSRAEDKRRTTRDYSLSTRVLALRVSRAIFIEQKGTDCLAVQASLDCVQLSARKSRTVTCKARASPVNENKVEAYLNGLVLLGQVRRCKNNRDRHCLVDYLSLYVNHWTVSSPYF